MSQALPLPTIPEGTDDESYGDGMDMDTLLDEMGLGDDDAPPTPPRHPQPHAKPAVPQRHDANPRLATSSPPRAAAELKPATRSPPQNHTLVGLTYPSLYGIDKSGLLMTPGCMPAATISVQHQDCCWLWLLMNGAYNVHSVGQPPC